MKLSVNKNEAKNLSRKYFRIWSRADLYDQTAYAAEVGPKILKYYEEYFNIKFPLPKQDMIAIPGMVLYMVLYVSLDHYSGKDNFPRIVIIRKAFMSTKIIYKKNQLN